DDRQARAVHVDSRGIIEALRKIYGADALANELTGKNVVAKTEGNVKPVADRVAAQNALFEEQYESDLRNLSERATAAVRRSAWCAIRSPDFIKAASLTAMSIAPGFLSDGTQ